jgi:lactate racemase
VNVALKYGEGTLNVPMQAARVDVIEPRYVPGLPDEKAAFLKAVRAPGGSAPLGTLIAPQHRVAVVIPDLTRPFPGRRVLPWLFEELGHVPPGQITIINGTGSHRANTPAELALMLGDEVAARYRVINHDAQAADALVAVGRMACGRQVRMNRAYAAADKRILLGFVEPHFMAGFSGGYKAIAPGLLGIDDILYYHRAELIADPGSTWGRLDGNPTQAFIRECGQLCPADFCVNVTLNRDRAITGVFAGNVLACHDRACAFARDTAICRVPQSYDIVVTTNGGYPLDQNLYQSVKGMSAARQIVRRGGYILCAAECRDGFPAHGNFRRLLFEHASPEALLRTILAPGFRVFDQWEAQLLAMIVLHAAVGLYSGLPRDEVRRAYLEPIADISARIKAEVARRGQDAAVAVLSEGPLTIPYVA